MLSPAPAGDQEGVMGQLASDLQGHYVVVSLSQIVRRVYIMCEPSYKGAKPVPAFWVNPFKYFQLPPDYGKEIDEADE